MLTASLSSMVRGLFAAALIAVVVVPLGLSPQSAYASAPAAGGCSEVSGELVCNVQDQLLAFNRVGEVDQTGAGTQNIGTSPSQGQSFTYTNVFTGSGTIVDATVTITSLTNPAAFTAGIDSDDTGISANNEAIAVFPGSGGDITLTVDFFERTTLRAVKMQNLAILVKDLDGGSAGRTERARFTGLTTYQLTTNTDVSVTSSGGQRTFSGTTNRNVVDKEGWVFAVFPTLSTVGLSATSNGGGGIGFVFNSSNPWGGTATNSTVVTPPSYDVDFNLDGGSGTAVSRVSGSGELTFPSGGGQSKNGELISAWSSQSGGLGSRVSLGGTYTPISSTTFYAVYEATVGSPSATSGTVGQAFSSTVTTSGFTSADLTFSVASGTLPAGLTLNSSTGAITGTPSAGGSQTLTLSALHSAGGSATTSSFTITVAPGTQVITWSPTTSLALADSGLTLAATLTTGDGTLAYTVIDPGTTGCTISGTTLSFSSIGSGDDGCEVRPSATSTSNYNAKDDAGTVTFDIARGTFDISSPSSKVGVTDSSFTDVCTATCAITGFAATDQVLVVVGKSGGTALSGRVRLEVVTGLTQGLTGYQANATAPAGHPELAFSGTQAQVNAALATLQYKAPAGGGDETLGLSASLTGAAYFAGTGSYYEFVATTVNWSTAKSQAAAATFNGMQGHLATVTSLAENQFITSKVGTATAWLAGTDSVVEGTWKWDAGAEAGETFWTGTGQSGFDHNTTSPFTYWGSSEPNNSGDEDCLEIVSGGTGRWNDIPCTSFKGYVIEYSSGEGAVLKEASTTFTVGAPTAPLQVTGVSATAGNTQTVLTWSAPESGGSAITDYLVEQFDPDTSTWTLLSDEVSTTSYTVTGLTNGTSYSFRVSAKNLVGTGPVSSTISATPAAPAPSGNGGSSPAPQPAVTPPATPSAPRIITPTQPTPRPTVLQGPVTSPGRGFDPTIGTRATVGGAPATVTNRPSPGGGVSVQAGTLQFGVSLSDPQGGGGVETRTPSNSPELRVPSGQSTSFTGGGLLPGSQVQVWLPSRTGNQATEIGRIPVKEDGSFEGELSFTSRQNEAPLPIGRQVMQVVGFDQNGNQTVVDMTINVSQGPVAPEFNRQQGSLPQLSTGQSLATSAGLPVSVTITPIPEQNTLTLGDGSWSMDVVVDPGGGQVGGTPDSPLIEMTQDSSASASGDGFMAGTSVSVWMFSDPTLMATVSVEEDGSFAATFVVDPLFLPAGNHTLQIQGVGEDGFIKAANLGVVVQEAATLTGESSLALLWWVLGMLLTIVVLGIVLWTIRRKTA